MPIVTIEIIGEEHELFIRRAAIKWGIVNGNEASIDECSLHVKNYIIRLLEDANVEQIKKEYMEDIPSDQEILDIIRSKVDVVM